MSSTSLYRLSGIALLIGSALAVAGAVLGIFSNNPASTLTIIGAGVAFVGAVLGIFGLPGMYTYQARRAGILGLIGTALLMFYTLVLGAFGNALNALVLPFLATNAPSLLNHPPFGVILFYTFGSLLGAIGGISLGIATIRAAILPRWTGVLLIIGVIIQFTGDLLQLPTADLGFLLVMIAFAGFGSALLSARQQINTSVPREVPASAVQY